MQLRHYEGITGALRLPRTHVTITPVIAIATDAIVRTTAVTTSPAAFREADAAGIRNQARFSQAWGEAGGWAGLSFAP